MTAIDDGGKAAAYSRAYRLVWAGIDPDEVAGEAALDMVLAELHDDEGECAPKTLSVGLVLRKMVLQMIDTDGSRESWERWLRDELATLAGWLQAPGGSR